jgi:putative addiction module CopG family antidote
MSTLSVPLTPDLERFIDEQVKMGEVENKAAVVRKALRFLRDEETVARILRSKRQADEGRLFRGDLDELAKLID